jgi:hypothetical protein
MNDLRVLQSLLLLSGDYARRRAPAKAIPL